MEGPSVVFREHSRVGDVVANDVSVAEFPAHNDETDRTVEVVASRLPVHIEFKLQPIILGKEDRLQLRRSHGSIYTSPIL